MLLKAGMRGVRRGDRWRGRLRGGESQDQPKQTFEEAETLSQRTYTCHFKPSNFHDCFLFLPQRTAKRQSLWDWKASSGRQSFWEPRASGHWFSFPLFPLRFGTEGHSNQVLRLTWSHRWLTSAAKGERGLPGKERKWGKYFSWTGHLRESLPRSSAPVKANRKSRKRTVQHLRTLQLQSWNTSGCC